jgi:hypothetical protein
MKRGTKYGFGAGRIKYKIPATLPARASIIAKMVNICLRLADDPLVR